MSGHAIHIRVDGRKYSGTYSVDRAILTVTTAFGRKEAEAGPKVPQQALALRLLEELVREEKSRKGSAI
jgi:hypothetical protein